MPRCTPSAALLLLTALAGCDTSPSEPRAAPVRPQLDFTNGPEALPHVLRSGGAVVTAWFDARTDYAIIIGAPDDPAEHRLCGGESRGTFIPVQWVGDFEEVVKQLALQRDISIRLYRPIPPSSFEALCLTEPVATGSGAYLRTDNDFFGAFGRANAFSEHVHGNVTFADGSSAQVSAKLYGVGSPAGELRFIDSRIGVRRTGG